MVAKHRQTKTDIYRVWIAMRSRCHTPSSTHFDRYGGRGIKVCERWNDFLAFKADMGPRPEGYTLERVDNDGPYSPDNCRWASRKEQSNNRDCNIRINHQGETLTVSQWAERTGLHRNTLFRRVGLGWPTQRIFAKHKQIDYSGLALGGAANAMRQQAKTHCKRGHKFTPENTGTQTSKKGTPSRFCRTCCRLLANERRASSIAEARAPTQH